jgi:hypothetical protein
MGQLALGKGPARLEIRYHGQGVDVQSKGFSFHTTKCALSILITCIHVCLKKRDSFVLLKINHVSRFDT